MPDHTLVGMRLILRFDTLSARPVAILAGTRNPVVCRVLREMSRTIDGAGFYLEANG
jgi:hypothetical protein